MEKVRITVTGYNNTGKTTIAHIIKAALDEQGFKSVLLKDAPSRVEHKEPIHVRVAKAKERPVEITVINLQDPPSQPTIYDDEDR